jgi:hypothetical protein
MTTSPPGSASAQKSDVMSDLEVRSPVPPTRSTTVLVEQVLARVRSGQPQARDAKSAAPAAALAPRPPQAGSTPNNLPDIEVRKPPGPQAKPAPAPLKGPAASTPPRGPASAAASQPGARRPAGAGAQAAQAGKPAAPSPQAATPPAAASAGPPGPPTATSLIDDSASWLPPEEERKVAFLQVFRYWHAQVRPEYAHKARPAFLFLVTALPVMVKARDTLEALNLWEPPGEHSRQARDTHPAWKKYCEFLPRATQALQELDDYRHLSLLTALDDLNARVIKAEKKFREGIPTVRPGARR